MALLHLPRAALLWTNSSDGDDLDNLFGPWPVTPSSLGPWPCYFLISFACAALEFRLSPNLRIEVRAEKHRHRHQKHTSSYRHHRPLQIKLPSIYMSFSKVSLSYSKVLGCLYGCTSPTFYATHMEIDTIQTKQIYRKPPLPPTSRFRWTDTLRFRAECRTAGVPPGPPH